MSFRWALHRASSKKSWNNADENEQLCTTMQSSDIKVNPVKSELGSVPLILKIHRKYQEVTTGSAYRTSNALS
jgi:hypothetical protein